MNKPGILVLLACAGACGTTAGVMPTGEWAGSCVGPNDGWGTIHVSLRLEPGPPEPGELALAATGVLAFVGRQARATLAGGRRGGRWELQGEMAELGGLGAPWRPTKWGIALALRGLDPDSPRLRGTFTELLEEGGSERMCELDWEPGR